MKRKQEAVDVTEREQVSESHEPSEMLALQTTERQLSPGPAAPQSLGSPICSGKDRWLHPLRRPRLSEALDVPA